MPSSPAAVALSRLAVLPLCLLLLKLSLLHATPCKAAASPPLPVTADQESYLLGPWLDILEDPGGAYTLRQVTAPVRQREFRPLAGPSFNPGFSNAAYWLRFTLQNQQRQAKSMILEVNSPLIDQVTLYQQRADGGYLQIQAGELLPMARRIFPHRKPVIPITLAGRQQFYLRVHNNGSVPIMLRLWQPAAFGHHSEIERYNLGIYYGATMVILFYNLVLYLMIRAPSYLYYVLYVTSYLFWQLAYNGLAIEFLWPNAPWINNHAIPLAISLAAITALQFARIFLRIPTLVPQFDRWIKVVISAFWVSAALAFFPRFTISMKLSALFALAFSPTLLVAAIICLGKGYRPARYFIIGWFCLIVGTAALGLKSFGLLPSTFATEYGQQIGSFLEILLLSLAIADKMQLIKREKEAAQEAALALERKANLVLEDQVTARTKELKESNQQLQLLSNKLAKYLSPQVYQAIFSGQNAVIRQTERKKLTVFFSDIKDFTRLTDRIEPEAMNQLLNSYLDRMTAIALRHGGTIDKFIGDAIMVFFGDPDSRGEREDALACVRMALEMRDFMLSSLAPESPLCPARPLQIRMGINTGHCTVGNFGSDHRLDYTIIGGQVNLASRLETNAQPNQILISETTYALVKDVVRCRKMGEIMVKGRAYPTTTYQVEGLLEAATLPRPIQVAGDGYYIAINPAAIQSTVDQQRLRQGLLQGLELVTADTEKGPAADHGPPCS